MNIEQFNQLDSAEAEALLLQSCAAKSWVRQMVRRRPYASAAALLDTADRVWSRMEENDWLEAFDGHPRIGDPDSLKAKYRDTHAMAGGEQSGVKLASEQVIEQLADANREYFERFGFIFIICASGKTAEEMRDSILQRQNNTRQQELVIAAAEQAKITAIRLRKLLSINAEHAQ